METTITETEVKQHLDHYYRQRADRLANLGLRDLLKRNSHLRNLIWTNDPVDVVDALIPHYLESYEKWWRELLKDNAFCLHVVKMQRTFWDSRYRYEHERHGARGRLVQAMIQQFCTVNYLLDWEKLLLVSDAG